MPRPQGFLIVLNLSSTEKLRYEDRGFLQSRLVWYDTPTECMRLLKMRLQAVR